MFRAKVTDPDIIAWHVNFLIHTKNLFCISTCNVKQNSYHFLNHHHQEPHHNYQWFIIIIMISGDETVEFFKTSFGLSVRESAAIMGAHTYGRWFLRLWEPPHYGSSHIWKAIVNRKRIMKIIREAHVLLGLLFGTYLMSGTLGLLLS